MFPCCQNKIGRSIGHGCSGAVKRGRIVEQGTHDELLARGGAYFTLVQMQQAGPQTMDNFARAIVHHPEITGAWDITGEDDFLLKVQVGSMEEYDAFTRRALGEDKGVHSFTTLIAIRNIIENGVARRPLRLRRR